MACIVAGFPSNIAALQFEWAWQNSHLTRHIAQGDRISFPVVKIKTNSRTGKTRRKPTRPPSSLLEKLSNLHLLLRAKYFSQWPLELQFFSEDVFRAWQTWSERVDGQVRPEIKVVLDLPQPQPQVLESDEFSSAQRPTKRRRVDDIGKGGVEGIDATYARYQDVFEKSKFILDEGDGQKCEVCRQSVNPETDLFTICTAGGCTSLSHVNCLSTHFLGDAGGTQVMPGVGHCPGCKQEVRWSELMRVVSLRIRGEKEVQKLLKKKRGTKAALAAEIMEEDEDDADADEELTTADVVDEHDDEDADDDEDGMTVASVESLDSVVADTESPARKGASRSKLEIVIEDSEDER